MNCNACTDIYCPDCGQGFPQAHCAERAGSSRVQRHASQNDETVFKKPTIFTKVIKSIWKPFGNTKLNQRQSFLSGTGSMFYDKDQVGSGMPVGMPNHAQRVQSNQYQRPRDEYDRSDVTSQSGSWLGSIFKYPWNRAVASEQQQETRAQNRFTESMNFVGQGSQQQNARPTGLNDDSNIYYEAEGTDEEEYYDDDADTESDRLNLREYLQPKRRKQEAVESWVNNLQDDLDAVNSLLSIDLSCDCKSGDSKVKTDLITDFLVAAGEQFVKLQDLLKIQEGYKEKELKFIRSLAKSTEQTKSALLDCSKTQQLIIFRHGTEMAKLDKAVEYEDKKMAKEQEDEVEDLQRRLFLETMKMGSESILNFYSSG